MIRFHDHGFGEFNAHRRVGPSCWDRFDLFLLHEGRVVLRLMERHELVLEPGEGVLIHPHTPFHGRSAAALSRASVQHFELTARGATARRRRDPVFGPLAGRRRGFERCRFARRGLFRREVERAMALALRPQTPLVHGLRVAQLTLILGQLLRTADRGLQSAPLPDAPWADLLAWLGQHLHEPVSIEQMAQRVGLSPSHFRARFRRELGVAPGQYLQDLRAQEAARRLRETSTPIKVLARELGYTDLPNFYRAFRTAIGLTPAAYRRRHALRG